LGNIFILIHLEYSGTIANIACNWGGVGDFVQGANCIWQFFDAPTVVQVVIYFSFSFLFFTLMDCCARM
jgi:hypothetical protein